MAHLRKSKSVRDGRSQKALGSSNPETRGGERGRLQSIMESTGAMMAYLDIDFNFVAVNTAYARRTGYTIPELVGKNHFALFPDAENRAVFKKVRDTAGAVTVPAKAFEIAEQPRRLTSSCDWTLGAVKGKGGRVQGFLLSMFESAGRKKAEEAIAAMSRFSAESPNPGLRMSRKGIILYSNPAGLSLLDEWRIEVGRPAPGRWREFAAEVLAEGSEKELEEEHGGRIFSFLFVPFVEADYVNVYGRDITKRKTVEKGLRRVQGELEMRARQRTREITETAARLKAEIAERKRAEAIVIAERRRFMDVLEGLPAYLILLTPDYRISYANRFFRERFGEDRGRRCYEYLFQRSQPCEVCETYKVFKTKSRLEWEWLGPDGHSYYIYDSPFVDTDGAMLILEVGIDITERKKAEEETRRAHDELEMHVQERTRDLLKTSEDLQEEIAERRETEEVLRQTRDFLESLIDYANAPIICWDKNFLITRFNRAFERMTGFATAEVIGRELKVLFPERSTEESLNKIRSTLAGERWEVVEIPIQRKDGEERIALWNSANIYAADGETLVATIAQGQDITDRKRAEQALKEYSSQLEQMVEERTKRLQDAQRLATIGETAGMVGHDIRNPLQTIEGAVFLAKETLGSLSADPKDAQELREDLDIIQSQAEYINHVVADLQEFARPPQPALKETDIRALINETLAVIDVPSNVAIQREFQENLPDLRVDPIYMKRVFLNLIENGIQAMPLGGRLTLRIVSQGPYTRISVQDGGVGIKEEHKSKIFMPLFTTKPKGQGFGLPVCRKLVNANGGDLTFESEEGKGSTFIITIPGAAKAG